MMRKIVIIVPAICFLVSCGDIWEDEKLPSLPPSPRRETKKEESGKQIENRQQEVILNREMFTGERVVAYLNPGEEVYIEFRIWKSAPKFYLETVEIEVQKEGEDAVPCELILGNYTRPETLLIFEEGQTPYPVSIALGKTNLYPLNSFVEGDVFSAGFTVTEEDIKDNGDSLALGLLQEEGSERGLTGFLNFGNCSKAHELLETLPYSFNSYELTIPIVYRAEIFLAVERARAEDKL